MRVKLWHEIPYGDYVIVTRFDWEDVCDGTKVADDIDDVFHFSVNQSWFRNQYGCNRIKLWFENHVHLYRERGTMRRIPGRKKTREFHYYYCNWWCFLSNQKLCKKPLKRLDSSEDQE